MASTLCELAKAIGWHADLVDRADLPGAGIDARSVVVVATQGHGDEEAMEQVVAAGPAYVGLVASRRRGEAVLGYLADRGVAPELLDRVRVPAELVQLRAAGALHVEGTPGAAAPGQPPTAIDPVCGMTVPADGTSRPFEHGGVTYYFCSAGCRSTFERDPAAHVPREARC
jgi:xanthine dehydrogenase accessory factor